jgi:hypothetical protein
MLHAALLALVLRSGAVAPPQTPPPMQVVLAPPFVQPPPPPPKPLAPEPAPKGPSKPAAPKPKVQAQEVPKRPAKVKPKPVPPEVKPRLVAAVETPEPTPPEPQVSAGELASALTAEGEGAGSGAGGGGAGGSGGGGCGMVRKLQAILRSDSSVRAAAMQAHRDSNRPILVWNGDWVRRGSESGKGLASVRQAIAVEVAFSPKACREQRMHGLVVLSLGDSPGAPRIVLGAGAWRWADLLS